MLVEVVHPYPCNVSTLFPWFCQDEALRLRNDRLGFRDLEIRRYEFDGKQATIELLRSVPAAAQVPRALRQFQQDWNRIRQEEQWHMDSTGVGHCHYSVRIPGLPVSINGKMRLENVAQGSTVSVALEISCGVPILGKMAVSYLAEDARIKLDQEHRVLLDLLAAA